MKRKLLPLLPSFLFLLLLPNISLATFTLVDFQIHHDFENDASYYGNILSTYCGGYYSFSTFHKTGAYSLTFYKNDTTSNCFGVKINLNSSYDFRPKELFMWLYIDPSVMDKIEHIYLYIFDSNGKAMYVAYDAYTGKEVGSGWNFLVWGMTRYSSKDSGFDQSKINSIAIAIHTKSSSDIIPEGRIYLDSVGTVKELSINNQGHFTYDTIADYFASIGYPFVERVGGYTKTYLQRISIKVSGDYDFEVKSLRILGDEFAFWSRYGTYTLLTYAPGSLLIEDSAYHQISQGYSWGTLIYCTNCVLKFSSFNAYVEHRIYLYENASIKNSNLFNVGVFPAGIHKNRSIENVRFLGFAGYQTWIHPNTKISDVYYTVSWITPFRNEMGGNITIKNVYVKKIDNREYLNVFTAVGKQNISVINVKSDALGFECLCGGSHVQNITWNILQEVQFRLLDDNGNPVQYGVVSIYDKNNHLVYRGDINSSGYTDVILLKMYDYSVNRSCTEPALRIGNDQLNSYFPFRVVFTIPIGTEYDNMTLSNFTPPLINHPYFSQLTYHYTNLTDIQMKIYKQLKTINQTSITQAVSRAEVPKAETYTCLFFLILGLIFMLIGEKTRVIAWYFLGVGILLANLFFAASIPFAVNEEGEVVGTPANGVLIGLNLLFILIGLVRMFPIVFEYFRR